MIELFLIPHVHITISRSQDVQLEVGLFEFIASPEYRQDNIDIDHGIDGLKTSRPKGAGGNKFLKRKVKNTRPGKDFAGPNGGFSGSPPPPQRLLSGRAGHLAV